MIKQIQIIRHPSPTNCLGVWLFYHVTYAFQSESTLYNCVNIKELLARNRHDIWSLSDNNAIRINNHLVRKRTLNHLESFGFKTHCCHSLGVFDHLVRSGLEELASFVSEISIVITDREHEFDDVIKHIHKKAWSKLDAFTGMTNIMAHQNNALFIFFCQGSVKSFSTSMDVLLAFIELFD